MVFKLPLCRFNRHSPDRGKAEWDGLNFVSTCVRCGEPIRRKQHKVWEREWLGAG